MCRWRRAAPRCPTGRPCVARSVVALAPRPLASAPTLAPTPPAPNASAPALCRRARSPLPLARQSQLIRRVVRVPRQPSLRRSVRRPQRRPRSHPSSAHRPTRPLAMRAPRSHAMQLRSRRPVKNEKCNSAPAGVYVGFCGALSWGPRWDGGGAGRGAVARDRARAIENSLLAPGTTPQASVHSEETGHRYSHSLISRFQSRNAPLRRPRPSESDRCSSDAETRVCVRGMLAGTWSAAC